MAYIPMLYVRLTYTSNELMNKKHCYSIVINVHATVLNWNMCYMHVKVYIKKIYIFPTKIIKHMFHAVYIMYF